MPDIPHIDEYQAVLMPDGHWIDSRGYEVWIKNGARHRTDGPAVICPRSKYRVRWWLNGIWYRTFESWLNANTYITDEEKVMLKLEYC